MKSFAFEMAISSLPIFPTIVFEALTTDLSLHRLMNPIRIDNMTTTKQSTSTRVPSLWTHCIFSLQDTRGPNEYHKPGSVTIGLLRVVACIVLLTVLHIKYKFFRQYFVPFCLWENNHYSIFPPVCLSIPPSLHSLIPSQSISQSVCEYLFSYHWWLYHHN